MKIEISDFVLEVTLGCLQSGMLQCDKFLETDPEALQTGSAFLGLQGMGEADPKDIHFLIRQTKAMFEECLSQLKKAIENAEK
jgi:hypothetical protein